MQLPPVIFVDKNVEIRLGSGYFTLEKDIVTIGTGKLQSFIADQCADAKVIGLKF